VGGLLLGIFLAVGFGVSGQSPAPTTPGRDWSHVIVFTYPTGVTGFFDQSTGRLYLYDTAADTCLSIRELTTLGNQTRRLR
jgi:hypothetical protein